MDEDLGLVMSLKMLADTGDPAAQCEYGLRLFKGVGVPKDLTEAAKYFKKSADQGNPLGQLRYGMCQMNGE
jgi:TPR repeat protein